MSLAHFGDDAELTGSDSIIAIGYTASVIDYLAAALKAKNGKVVLNSPVATVSYSAAGVTLTTVAGKTYQAAFAVVTLPVGVLNAGTVKFSPPLPTSKVGAVSRIGMGTLNKVILQFSRTAKLPAVNWIDRIPLASDKGRWREFFSLKKAAGRPVTVAFTAGSAALYGADVTDAQLATEALAALRGMYTSAKLPKYEKVWVTR
jgi:monoamine oxidase